MWFWGWSYKRGSTVLQLWKLPQYYIAVAGLAAIIKKTLFKWLHMAKWQYNAKRNTNRKVALNDQWTLAYPPYVPLTSHHKQRELTCMQEIVRSEHPWHAWEELYSATSPIKFASTIPIPPMASYHVSVTVTCTEERTIPQSTNFKKSAYRIIFSRWVSLLPWKVHYVNVLTKTSVSKILLNCII